MKNTVTCRVVSFLRELIRREQDRAQLRGLLVKGMESGVGSEMDDDYFEQLRERIRHSGPT